MMYVFVFGPVAVTSEHFETLEPDGSHEFGTRIQLRRMRYDVVDGVRHSAGRDGLHSTIGAPIWRADLFGVVGGAPGNHDHAHFHPSFTGMEPCERVFDQAVVDDPVGWAKGQLSDLREVLTVGGAAELIPEVNQSELDAAWPAIEASIRANFDGPRYARDEVREKAFTH
jgi:hypothetical protein